MKIAHIIDTPFDYHGGLTLLAREIALGLSIEFETYVFCPRSGSSASDTLIGSHAIRLIEWNPGDPKIGIEKLVREKLNTLGIRVAIVHGGDFSWGPMQGRLSLINRISKAGRVIILINHQSNPVFSRLPTGSPQSIVSRIRSFLRFSVAWFFKHIQLFATDLEITVSEFEYRQAKRRYFLFRKKFKLIHHSRLPELAGVEESTQKQNIILSVGHFAYRKGQHVLVKAFGRVSENHPSWSLQLVGASNANEYNSFISSIIRNFEIADRTHIVHETYQPDEYFKRASIYVQPSLVEAYGLALQEAMHFGCACVGSDTGGIPDSVSDPEFRFKPGDDVQLARILDRLMSDSKFLGIRMHHDHLASKTLNRNRNSMLDSYRRIISELIPDLTD